MLLVLPSLGGRQARVSLLTNGERVEALNYIIIATAVLVGLGVGYQWGFDIGYHDRINDEVNAQLRARKNRA